MTFGAPVAHADDAAQTVIVTGSVRDRQAFEAPYAIGVVDAQTLHDGGPMVNLSEAMARVPGLNVSNRNNYAQDLQISSRGFGARSTFGVRGLRLYSDGIPASMPDGQGQVAHFDLAGAARVEVLRGPFSVLYGNSSGGVIALFSAPVGERRAEAGIDAGEFGLRQARASLALPMEDGFELRASASRLLVDGFRPQSEAERNLGNLRAAWRGAADTVTVQLSDHTQAAQDPLGLTRAQFALGPEQTAAQATQFNTRKTIRQSQGGINWRHRFGEGGVLRETSLTAYVGSRGVTQFLAIPALTQSNPAVPSSQRHGGGVVDFDRHYDGQEARARLGWTDVDVVVGLVQERQLDDRRGYENFLGPPASPTALGVVGALRRDETNGARTRDAFAQAEWTLDAQWSALAGVRSGGVDMRVEDRYVQGLNGNDSGTLRFSYTNPVVGLRWTPQPQWIVHLSAARGFESPTLGELAYTANNSGFNFALKGQRSTQLELGSKWRGGGIDVDGAVFLVDTDDEIGVLSSAGGRSAFQNVGRTRRYGAEAALAWHVTESLRLGSAVSLLHARYRDGFGTCLASPCPSAANPLVPVAAGNRIAGTQDASAFAELAWKPGVLPGEFAIEWRAQGKTPVNDVNGEFAPGFAVASLRWSHRIALGEGSSLELLVRVDNVADRRYAGSVIVGDANGRFYEPGSPRAAMASLRWSQKF
ncbi:MAG: TonB-dependent receptor [Burkholderiaceae bacterium]